MTMMTPAGRDLLRTAVLALDDAYQAETPAQRYVAAHIAALRAGAALLAVRAKPSRSRRIRSVWQMVPGVAPDHAALTEWCAYFDAVGRRRVFVEIGREAVTQRQADDLMRDAATFLDLIAGLLGIGGPLRMAG
jgi:hypothetical protein